MEVTLPAALLAGLLSFVSPCVLPLVVPYLGFIGGVTLHAGADGAIEARGERGRVMRAAVAFVLGFATVFTALGATATTISGLLADHLDTLALVAGGALVLLGLSFAGLFRIPLLQREARYQVERRPVSFIGAYGVGLAFAFGWSPCVGPVLAGILTVAAAQQGAAQGALLLFVYALGIGIPFLLAAAFATRFIGLAKRLRPWMRGVELAIGGLLVVTGILLMTGRFAMIGAWLLDTFPVLGRLG
ncbi:MAG: cytochrome c biogenesis protein CcdA [Roseomonas sp.]|nr:cytochrome c biogenesis protein CcdA [Roseomonas sp.]